MLWIVTMCTGFCLLFISTYWVYQIYPQDFMQNALGFYALHALNFALWPYLLDFVHYVVGLCTLEYGQGDPIDFNRSYVIRVKWCHIPSWRCLGLFKNVVYFMKLCVSILWFAFSIVQHLMVFTDVIMLVRKVETCWWFINLC
jgi:hypothetical protein